MAQVDHLSSTSSTLANSLRHSADKSRQTLEELTGHCSDLHGSVSGRELPHGYVKAAELHRLQVFVDAVACLLQVWWSEASCGAPGPASWWTLRPKDREPTLELFLLKLRPSMR